MTTGPWYHLLPPTKLPIITYFVYHTELLLMLFYKIRLTYRSTCSQGYGSGWKGETSSLLKATSLLGVQKCNVTMVITWGWRYGLPSKGHGPT